MKTSTKIPIISTISSHTTLSDSEGIILWWNEASGAGIAQTNHGLGYIEWNEASENDFITFASGDHVSFGSKRHAPTDWMFGPCSLRLERVAKKGGVPEILTKPYYPGQTTTRNRVSS